MTIMIADNRACAHAISGLLAPKPPEGRKADRQKEILEAYFFGHYDSRGGAAMVLASDHIEALKKYLKAFFCVDVDGADEDGHKAWLESQGSSGPELEQEHREYISSMINAAQEDFLFKAAAVVCDEPLPAEGDLDKDYSEDGYSYAQVQYRYEKRDYSEGTPVGGAPTGKFSKWVDASTVVLWKGRRPPALMLNTSCLHEQFRLKKLSLGEDACGLVLIR